MKILAIDPSIRKLGYAVFDSNHLDSTPALIDSGTISLRKAKTPKNKLEWVDRVDEMVRIIRSIIANLEPPSHVLIELPTHYTSKRGDAAKNSSSILKLMFLVATLRQHFLGSNNPNQTPKVILIPVAKWKGQSPKHITQRRVFRSYPHLTKRIPQPDHNELDAIGIGRWYINQQQSQSRK